MKIALLGHGFNPRAGQADVELDHILVKNKFYAEFSFTYRVLPKMLDVNLFLLKMPNIGGQHINNKSLNYDDEQYSGEVMGEIYALLSALEMMYCLRCLV